MFQSKQLEVCTDTCKDEKDMPCINNCGTQYMQNTADEYDSVLGDYLKNYYGVSKTINWIIKLNY